MILQVFSVFDSMVGAYLPPFYMQSKGGALRAFTDSVNDFDHQFNKHPHDFCLFELGSFDDSNCSFELLNCPVSLGLAIEFKKVEDFRNLRPNDLGVSTALSK